MTIDIESLEMKPVGRVRAASGVPYVTHEGVMELPGISFRVLQLSNRKRIIPSDDFARVIAWLSGGHFKGVEGV